MLEIKWKERALSFRNKISPWFIKIIIIIIRMGAKEKEKSQSEKDFSSKLAKEKTSSFGWVKIKKYFWVWGEKLKVWH